MKPQFTMLVGLPGSGKSMYANQKSFEFDSIISFGPNHKVFSSDALREELLGDATDQTNNQKVFQELHKRIKDALRNGDNAVYDACNISSKRRRGFLEELKNINCSKVCVVMATPYAQCLRNNENRERVVPKEVIRNMYLKWQTPHWFEGWDRIQLNMCYNAHLINPVQVADSLICFNQHNPHHTLTLGEHMIKTADLVSANDDCDVNIYAAALTHDMGKPAVQTIDWDKQISHYYSHEHVSAYESLFINERCLKDVNPLKVSALVTWHMQLYFYERDGNEKLHNKYKKIWGAEFYNDLMTLHEADKKAH